MLTISGETHTLRHSIGDVLETEEIILVKLNPESGEYDSRNVLGFDPTGTKVWESEVPEKDTRHTFSGIALRDGEIIGRSWNNHWYAIDPETGALDDRGFAGK
ncbi:hypothetical protein C479_09468 [Halovivax asiaticus JCM 14624]|uniref:Pyrrolo-quinoline quinone n=1 Tax=Halovivax asiaticus JCM 14624 TaxID=1227490 RepID=M0BN61_9EURY|nr:hypothetical protein C479_09468 [Halovivax asiaticus JCM 14624]